MNNLLRDSRFWIGIGLLGMAIAAWIFSGLVRLGTPPEPMGIAARVLLILIIAGIVVGVYLLATRASGRTNARVLDEIAGCDPGAGDTSKVSEEEEQLREKFREASSRVSKLRFGELGSRKHLYQLPWYVVIGSPGSGKTTAIKQSGLEFPLDDITQGGSLGGVGGTRNCDWWVTEQAVLLDTAGRYTTHDSDAGKDAQGWKNFLNLLRKHRKRQPLNGAILVVSTEELLHMSDEQWKNHSRTITRRLHELTSELQLSFPVYLVVTKVDLLSGCREFFDYLESDEEEQIWGTTFAEDEDLSVIVGQLKGLTERLHDQLTTKLRYERDVRRRRAIYSFPWQLEAVSARIGELAQAVFAHHSVADTTRLRGVYFSSAVQEGTPIERLVGGVAGGFGITGGQLSTKTQQSRSLFLRRLFPEVIFREAFLAGTNTQHEKNMQRLRLAAFAGIILAGIGIAIVWSSAFAIHRTLLAEAREELASFEATPHGADKTLAENLYALQFLESSTRVFSQQEHPWLSTLGMYDGSIDEASKNAYTRSVGALVAPAIGRSILASMDAYRNVDFQTRFDALKAYLMLAMPERRDAQWLVDWAGANRLGELQGEDAQIAAAHLANLFDRNPEYALPEYDEDAVERQRTRLARVSIAEQLYSSLRADFAGDSVDIGTDLGPYFLSSFELQTDDALMVDRLFTRSGYAETSFTPQSGWVLSWVRDRWVLGDETVPSPLDLAREIEAAKRLYALDYIDVWNGLLGGVNLVASSGERLNNNLRHLSEPSLSPMSMLLETVVNETSLEDSNTAGEAAKKALELAEQRNSRLSRANTNLRALAPSIEFYNVPEAVNAAFDEYHFMADGDRASKSSRVTQEIGRLRQWLARSQSARPNDGDDPVRQLLLTSEELASPFSEWVANLAYGARDAAGANRMGRINQLWRQEVTSVCMEAFQGKFPFVLSAADSVTVGDFDRFFRPGGIEDSFVETYLAPIQQQNDGTLSKATRWTMRQGERVRSAFYGGGSNPGFTYELTGVDVDDRFGQLIIESGDQQTVRYRHGPPVPLELKWPDGNKGITITYALKDGSRKRRVIPGPWAIFRLAAESSMGRAGGGNGILVSLGRDGYRAIFRLDANTSVSPFAGGLLSNYQCRDAP